MAEPSTKRARIEPNELEVVMKGKFEIAPQRLVQALQNEISYAAGDKCYMFAGQPFGKVSPFGVVTEHFAGVKDAGFFTFAMPIHPGEEEQTHTWKKKLSELQLEGQNLRVAKAFFEIGGFLLFDRFVRLVEVQACLPGTGIKLRQGQPLKPSCKTLVKELGDRLDKTTITKLMNVKFAWVLPGEQIAGMKAFPSGAFLYLCEDRDVAYVRPLYMRARGASMAPEDWNEAETEAETEARTSPAAAASGGDYPPPSSRLWR